MFLSVTFGCMVHWLARFMVYWVGSQVSRKSANQSGSPSLLFLKGTMSIMTMVVIGYDRYNVIVKGFNGVKITPGIAAVILILIYIYSVFSCIGPFFGWGGYALGKITFDCFYNIACNHNLLPEGVLLTCSYDYLTEGWNHKSFVLVAFIFNYCIPMITVIFLYSQIVAAVVQHEAGLKKQAKKMNVDSLRSNAVRTIYKYHLLYSIHLTSPSNIFCRIQMLRVRRSGLPRWPSPTSSCGQPYGLPMQSSS